MNYTKIFKLAKKFDKKAQQQLSDAAIKNVVVAYYDEAGVGAPSDVRIQYEKLENEPSQHVQPKHYNVYVWSNSYLDPPHDSTIQSRLHQAFDPYDELYNFYVKFFNSEE
jgi:hypothetical protein